jgi:hypothetical protein
MSILRPIHESGLTQIPTSVRKLELSEKPSTAERRDMRAEAKPAAEAQAAAPQMERAEG